MAADTNDSFSADNLHRWRQQLDALTRQLHELEDQTHQLTIKLLNARRQLDAGAREAGLGPEIRTQPPGPSPPVSPKSVPPPLAGIAPPAKVRPDVVEAPAQPPAPAGPIGSLEARIGGAWLGWLGAALVLLAAAWFFKLAIDKGWISPPLRVGVGWAVSMVLLALGEYAGRRAMPWFAASVTGAGLGVAYTATWAASPEFFNLLPLTASYALMSLITVIGLVQAVRLDQLAVAVLALLGGFITLVILRTPHPTAAGLLGYLLALSIGALGAGQLRTWHALRHLAWAGTAILIGAWLAGPHKPGTELPTAIPLLCLLYVLYQADVFWARWRQPDLAPHAPAASSGVNCTGFLLAIVALLRSDQVATIAGAAFFAVAAFQLVLARALWVLRPSEHNRNVAIHFCSQASLAAALGLPVAFDRSVIVLGWSAQAVTIAWFVRHVGSVLLRVKVAALLAAALVYIAVHFGSGFMAQGPTLAGLHLATIVWLAGAVAVGAAGCAWLLARWYARSTWELERVLAELCVLIAAAAGTVSVVRLVWAEPDVLAWTWTAAAAAAALGLLAYRAAALRVPGLMTVALLACAVLVVNTLTGALGRNLLAPQPWAIGPADVGPLLSLGLALCVLAYWNGWLCRHGRSAAHLPAAMGDVLAAAATGALLLVLWDQLADDSPAYAAIAGVAAAVALTGPGRIWARPDFGVWAAAAWVVTAGYWIVAATTLVRLPVTGGVPEAWAATRPCANATFLGGLLLVGAAYIVSVALKRSSLLRETGRRLLRPVPPVLAAYILVHGFSFEVDRWFQGSGAGRFEDAAHAELVALSVLWALLALAYVSAGLVFSIRPLRLFGLLIFAVTAAKALVLDMASVEVVYRVLSAMGLGVLALAGSYAYQHSRVAATRRTEPAGGQAPSEGP